jgi:hypothetical protein
MRVSKVLGKIKYNLTEVKQLRKIMMGKIRYSIGVVMFLGFLLGVASPALAQESTRQRTTGTYLPASAASISKESVVDNQAVGEVALSDGSLTMQTPAGVSDQKLRITLRRVSRINNDIIPALNISGEDFVGTDVFQLSAVADTSGQPVLKFSKNVKLVFRYLDDEVKGFDETSLHVRYFDRLNQRWVQLDTVRNLDSNTLTVDVNHLTIFAITGVRTAASNTSGSTSSSNTNQGMPLWQKILIGLILLSVVVFGVWYAYQLYLQSSYGLSNTNNFVLGGSQESLPKEKNNTVIGAEEQELPKNNFQSASPAGLSATPSTNSSTASASQPTKSASTKKEGSDKPDDEIWVNF